MKLTPVIITSFAAATVASTVANTVALVIATTVATNVAAVIAKPVATAAAITQHIGAVGRRNLLATVSKRATGAVGLEHATSEHATPAHATSGSSDSPKSPKPNFDWRTDDAATDQFLKTGNPGLQKDWEEHMCKNFGKLECGYHLQSAHVKVLPYHGGHFIETSNLRPDIRGSETAHVYHTGDVERVPPNWPAGLAKQEAWRKAHPAEAEREEMTSTGTLHDPTVDWHEPVHEDPMHMQGNLPIDRIGVAKQNKHNAQVWDATRNFGSGHPHW